LEGILLTTSKQGKRRHIKRKMLPSKSTTKQTKIFLVLEFCKLKRNSIPPTTQAKQRRKKKVPSKLLHNSLPTSNIIDFKTTSKPNIK